jgi:hypothetical protein
VALDGERLDAVQPHRDVIVAALDAVPADDPVPESVTAAFTALYDEEEQYVNAVAGLAAPEEVETARDEAVAAHREQIAFARGVVAQIDTGTTMAELEMLFSTNEALLIDQRRVDTCLALVQIATDSGITAELEC